MRRGWGTADLGIVAGLMLVGVMALAGIGIAQTKDTPKEPAAKVEAAKPAEPPPQVSQDAKAKLSQLQQQAASIGYAMSVLQKEQDATLAELNRTVQSLQIAGWQLDGSQGIANLKYIKAPTPEPPKGEPPPQ